MASIKRGVSSYSYQNLIFARKMGYRDFIRTIREDLNTDGVELIDETFINGYPFLSDEFAYDWKNTLARYDMKAVTMDVYLDVLQFRDHVMTFEEAAERLKRDLVIASRLGFQNVRLLRAIPGEVIDLCIPTAEKVGVRIGQEIHSPVQIRYDAARDWNKARGNLVDEQLVEHMLERAERTPFVGLVPDMGLFQTGVTPHMVAAVRRQLQCDDCVDYILERRGQVPWQDLKRMVAEQFPQVDTDSHNVLSLIRPQASAKPEELMDVMHIILSIHGKFYEMVEDPQNPGHYYEPSIPYDEIMKYLIQGGYDGYINSEFEGQGHTNDLPDEQMFDEREQVRRQHQMLVELGAV